MDTRRKNQMFFYLDIILLGLGAIALVVLVHDAFLAGYLSEANPAAYSEYVVRMSIEASTVILTLAYFLARFYRTRVRELSNPWG